MAEDAAGGTLVPGQLPLDTADSDFRRALAAEHAVRHPAPGLLECGYCCQLAAARILFGLTP